MQYLLYFFSYINSTMWFQYIVSFKFFFNTYFRYFSLGMSIFKITSSIIISSLFLINTKFALFCHGWYDFLYTKLNFVPKFFKIFPFFLFSNLNLLSNYMFFCWYIFFISVFKKHKISLKIFFNISLSSILHSYHL